MVTFAEIWDKYSGDELFCPHCGKWDIEFPSGELDCRLNTADIICPECQGKIHIEAYYEVITQFDVEKR